MTYSHALVRARPPPCSYPLNLFPFVIACLRPIGLSNGFFSLNEFVFLSLLYNTTDHGLAPRDRPQHLHTRFRRAEPCLSPSRRRSLHCPWCRSISSHNTRLSTGQDLVCEQVLAAHSNFIPSRPVPSSTAHHVATPPAASSPPPQAWTSPGNTF